MRKKWGLERSKAGNSQTSVPSSIVKTANFAPHGNSEPILARSVASLDEFCTNHSLHISSVSTTFNFFIFL
jgi:hypothetical protein